MADNARKLYDALTAKGIPLGDYDLYSQKIQDANNRKKLFDVATNSGVPVGDFQMFESKLIGEQKPTQQTTDLSNRIAKTTGNPILATMTNVAQRSISSIPQSAGNFIGGMAEAVTSPVQTVKGLTKILAGGLEKATGIDGESVKNFDAFTNYFVNRYGGISNIKNTLEQDPVGLAADAATFLGGTGGVLSKAGNIGKLNPFVRAGETVSAIGKTIDPISVATGVTKFTAGKVIPKSIAPRLYGSAIKASTGLTAEEKAARITTGLKEGIPISESGFKTLRSSIEQINNDIGNKISQAGKRGVTIPADDIIKRVEDVKRFFQNTLTPKTYLDQIDDLTKEFKQYHGANIPIEKAQKIKQNTYTLLNKAYGEFKTASVETQKNLARGIKEEIAQRYPEINKLNARESALIELDDSIVKALNRINNKDLIGIGTPIAGSAAATMLGSKTAGVEIGIMKSILDNPMVKSKIAIALNKAHRAKLDELFKGSKITKAGSLLNAIQNSSVQ